MDAFVSGVAAIFNADLVDGNVANQSGAARELGITKDADDRPFFARSRRRICRCLICSTDFTTILFPKVEPATLNFCSLNGKSRTTQHKGRHPRKVTAFISSICQSAIGNQPRTTTLRRLPMPSTCTIASSPGSRWPEAFGVPVRITSPGSSVVKLEIAAICSGMP